MKAHDLRGPSAARPLKLTVRDTPHLTLGRIRQIRKREAWLTGLNEVRNVRLPGFDVTAVSLISSDLKPTGAVYRELGSVTLEQGSAPAEVPPSRSS